MAIAYPFDNDRHIVMHQFPWRHWTIPGLLSVESCKRVVESLPEPESAWWIRYANDREKKRTTRGHEATDKAFRSLLLRLTSEEFTGRLAQACRIWDLKADPTLYGGGIHVTDPGGYLDPHVDYAMRPNADRDQERRLNLIVFLSPEWRPEWGGALQFYAEDGETVRMRIFPYPGLAVLWEPTEQPEEPMLYHGTQRVADDAPPRITAACYYHTAPRPG